MTSLLLTLTFVDNLFAIVCENEGPIRSKTML